MVTCIPDTNTWVQLLRGDRSTKENFESRNYQEVGLSCIVLEELPVGAYQLRSKQGMQAVETLIQLYPILAFDQGCADIGGKLQSELVRAGMKLGSRDAQIAGTAIHLDSVLVTHDKAFSRIVGLKLEDWR